jgi:hypothetical protein
VSALEQGARHAPPRWPGGGDSAGPRQLVRAPPLCSRARHLACLEHIHTHRPVAACVFDTHAQPPTLLLLAHHARDAHEGAHAHNTTSGQPAAHVARAPTGTTALHRTRRPPHTCASLLVYGRRGAAAQRRAAARSHHDTHPRSTRHPQVRPRAGLQALAHARPRPMRVDGGSRPARRRACGTPQHACVHAARVAGHTQPPVHAPRAPSITCPYSPAPPPTHTTHTHRPYRQTLPSQPLDILVLAGWPAPVQAHTQTHAHTHIHAHTPTHTHTHTHTHDGRLATKKNQTRAGPGSLPLAAAQAPRGFTQRRPGATARQHTRECRAAATAAR